MDTISLKLELRQEAEHSWEEWADIKQKMNSFRSPYGYTYVDVLEVDEKGYIIKLSYPRFFAGINAYLVTSIAECREVQKYFIQQLSIWGLSDYFTGIRLLRVDIPFTYYMDHGTFFYYYENVFRILAWIYNRHFEKSSPKAISEILTQRQETLYYTDSKVIGNYNSRVMIYDQHLNIQNKVEEAEEYRSIVETFPDLSRRIRLEVSKRISRQSMSLEQFQEEDLYGHYFLQYKEYILENLFNLEDLECYYEEMATQIAQRLLEFREKEGNSFTYEAFLLQNIGVIWDYEMIRRALQKLEMNKNTRENAITKIRKILKTWEENHEVLILDVRQIFMQIHFCIQNYFPKEEKS